MFKKEDFHPDDFRKMLFNPYPLANDVNNIAVVFPKLSVYPEFNQPPPKGIKSNSMIIKYIFFLYDKNSPLWKISDYYERKVVTAQLAGFEFGIDSKFTDPYNDIMNCRSEWVNLMIVRFLRIQHDLKWTLFVGLLEHFYTGTLPTLLTGGDLKTPDVQKAINQLEELKVEILSGETNKNLEHTMYSVINEDVPEILRKLRPEYQAKNV